jgi:hypothetical protein
MLEEPQTVFFVESYDNLRATVALKSVSLVDEVFANLFIAIEFSGHDGMDIALLIVKGLLSLMAQVDD